MSDTEARKAKPVGLPPLSSQERQRYSRHLTLPNVGLEGQQRFKAARILIVGAGGLGSPVALYLAAAGIGTLGLVDFDQVDVTNLQRQLLHGTKDVGRPKLDSAADRIRDVNPHVHVERFDTRLTSANAMEIIRDYDIVVDGTDNFATRYLTNDACVLHGKPNVYGSIFRFEGQASIFATRDGPCYRCLIPEPPPPGMVPSCAEGGVLGVLPGIVGSIQAVETLKLVLGAGESLAGRLLLIDALTMEFRTMRLRRDPNCPACGTRTITELIDYDEFCGVNPLEIVGDSEPEITPAELAALMSDESSVEVIDVREPSEWEVSHIDGSRLIPLGQLPDKLDAIDRSREVVVVCQSGMRSATAAQLLRSSGFERVRSLAGGVLRWDVENAAVRGR